MKNLPLHKLPFRLCLLAAALLVLMGALTGCGSQEKTKIIFMLHHDNGRIGSIIKEEFAKIATLHNQDVEFLDGQGDAALQISQIEYASRQGNATIVLLAGDEEKLVPAVEKALSYGTAVIPVNRHLRSNKISGVYPDEYGAGTLQAGFLEQRLPPGANIVYLQGDAAQYSSQRRWEGFRDKCLEKRRDMVLLDRKDGAYQQDEGYRIMKEWLARYDRIDAVVCGNDAMALGAVAALKEAGRLQGCLVSGIDAMDAALDAIAAGEMAQTVKQDATHQAAGAYQLAYEYSHGVQHPSDILVPFISITKENLAKFRHES